LIGQHKRCAHRAQGIGCSPQRNQGGAEGGGHSRRGVPGGLCTRPGQERQERIRSNNSNPRRSN